MAEATNPQTGVEQQQSVQQRLVQFYVSQGEKSATQPTPKAPKATESPEADASPASAEDTPEAEPEAEAAPAEESTDDAPQEDAEGEEPAEEQQQASGDEFEIVHNGQQHKLTRAETIELASKGFDYTQKTQALAAQEKQIGEALQAAQQIAQVQASLAPDISQVEGFRAALKDYQGVDWVALAQQDVSLYAQHRARFDQMRDGLMFAEQQLNQKFAVIQEGQKKAFEAVLSSEYDRMLAAFPEWSKDANKRKSDLAALKEAAKKDGYTDDELANVTQARYVRTLWKAAQYDRIKAAEGVKLKQMRTASPMAKPGAASPAPAPGVQREQKLRAELKKSGDWRAAASLFALQEKRKMK